MLFSQHPNSQKVSFFMYPSYSRKTTFIFKKTPENEEGFQKNKIIIAYHYHYYLIFKYIIKTDLTNQNNYHKPIISSIRFVQ